MGFKDESQDAPKLKIRMIDFYMQKTQDVMGTLMGIEEQAGVVFIEAFSRSGSGVRLKK